MYMEYLKSFLIGGGIISGSKVAARLMGPELAPIVGGLPTGIIAAFFLNTNHAKQKYFEGYAYSSFLLFLAILSIHIATRHFKNTNVNIISGIAFAVWLLLSVLVINMHKKGVF